MISRHFFSGCFLTLCLFCLFPAVTSAVDIPEQLEPWVPWVLHNQDDRFCTSSSAGDQQFCIWPEQLIMKLNGSGGSFSQNWQMKRDGWIALPGKEKYWPQQVTINGEPATVINKKETPAIHVEQAGRYDIRGNFAWKSLPESIPMPAGTGFVRLTIDGSERPADISDGILWISSRSSEQEIKIEDTVHTQVYRLIKDSIPMTVTNRIDVQVSGKPREILIDWQPPKDQIPLSLQCNLPVMIGTDGRIHMQAQPGNHTVIYRSRLSGPVNSLLFTDYGSGPDTEYWSFEAQNHLRMVKIGGPPAVDPSQTTIPPKWHSFPAYMVKRGQSLEFETLKRGNPEPPPNKLTIHRSIWLDSDGTGMTVQDLLTGEVHKEPRLEMQPPAALGRMVINGRDQLITQVKADGPAGVEVRQGQINGMAVSRIEKTRSFPAGGWGQSVSKLSGELVLPPGWTLLYCSGVDRVQSWISKWTLLDCFIVLIIIISAFRLLGIPKGFIALIALLLSYHDPDAPVYMWLALLACIAILKALPDTKHTHMIRRVKLLLLTCLVIMVLPYSVNQLRVGFFPQLEQVYNPYIPPLEQVADAVMEDETVPTPQTANQYMKRSVSKLKSAPAGTNYTRQQQSEPQYDVQSKVQAGPGIPIQKWRVIRLQWNGPVEPGLDIKLLLISPLANLIITIVKITAIFLLAFFMVDLKRDGTVRFEAAYPDKKTMTALLLLLFSGFFHVADGHSSDYPDPQMLNDLRTRLLEPEKCFPYCADIDKMKVELKGTGITLSIEAAAKTECAVRLPAGKGILWQEIALNGLHTPLISSKGELWTGIPEGSSRIRMRGHLNRTDLQLQLPHKPHLLEFDGHDEWTVIGLDENNVPEDQLQFIKKEETQEQAGFTATTLPPLMQVKRVLHLGLQWRLETIITRLSPPGSSVFLEIPLLDGESVTNGLFEVKDGMIRVPFGPDEQQKIYGSVFKEQQKITLSAPETDKWYEIWRLNVSPVWHIEADGFPPILHHSLHGTWQPEWHPWPKEQLTLTVTRPSGVPGPTKTIESSRLNISPGLRSTTMQLDFNIRSTRGDQQKITLPEDAVVQSIRVNGRQQPVKKDNSIIIPLNPANHHVEIEWRTSQGISSLFTGPEIDLGSESVNSDIEIKIGNRWVWYVSGPQMGPAILFYSELLIILLVSILLGRSKLTPLKSYHWMILGFGLCQSGLIPCLIIVFWFIALRIRREKGGLLSEGWFNFTQFLLIILTIATVGALAFAVRNGLLGHPDMLISGNDSSSYLLRWYQDRITDTVLPQPMVVSIPIMAYRITMLTWALWMAFHLLHWTKWGWECFSKGNIWHKTEINLKRKKKKEQ